jgi:hypothetical protein
MKFEAAIKNSLINLTTTWINRFPILGMHISNDNPSMLPVIIRESGLFNLVPMSFLESLNFSLNSFVAEFKLEHE